MNTLHPSWFLPALALASCASTSPSSSYSAPIVAESPAAEAPSPVPLAIAQTGVYGPQAEDWEFTLAGTGANDNDFEVGGFAVSGSVGYFLDERQELGVRQSVSQSDFGNTVWNGSTRVFYDYHLMDQEVRPLIGGNFGWVYGDTVDETLAAAPEAGLKWYLTDTAFLFLLAEYQFFFEDAEDADDTFSDGSFVYTVGFGVRK